MDALLLMRGRGSALLVACRDRVAQVHQVKEALRALRDVQRAPDGAPAAPDLVALQQAFQQGGGGVAQVGVEGVAALAVKLVGKAAMGLARQL